MGAAAQQVSQPHGNRDNQRAAAGDSSGYAVLLERLRRLTGARGGKALWAIICCMIVEGGEPVQWSRRELVARTGFSEAAIDEALALAEAAGILARQAGARRSGQGGLTPIVLALAQPAHSPRNGVSTGGAVPDECRSEPGNTPRPRVSTARLQGPDWQRKKDNHRQEGATGRSVDSTHDSTSSVETTTLSRDVNSLINRLAAKASTATHDAAPHLMREQVARVVARLNVDGWQPEAMAALVDEAIRRSIGQRHAAGYCWRTLWQLVEEAWRPAARAVCEPVQAGHGGPSAGIPGRDGASCDVPSVADGMLATSLDSGEPPALASLDAVSIASGGVIGVRQLWHAVLDDVAHRNGEVRSIEHLRWRTLIASSETEFWLDTLASDAVRLARLRPAFEEAFRRCLGRPATFHATLPR